MSNAAEDAPLASASGAGGLLGKLPKELWWALLELFALTGLAIAQPLLDVTGKAPDFFLYHRAGRNQILAVIALIVLAVRWYLRFGLSATSTTSGLGDDSSLAQRSDCYL